VRVVAPQVKRAKTIRISKTHGKKIVKQIEQEVQKKPAGIRLRVHIAPLVAVALKKAASEKHLGLEKTARIAIEGWLRQSGYLGYVG